MIQAKVAHHSAKRGGGPVHFHKSFGWQANFQNAHVLLGFFAFQ
jgi:hypothetical protein